MKYIKLLGSYRFSEGKGLAIGQSPATLVKTQDFNSMVGFIPKKVRGW